MKILIYTMTDPAPVAAALERTGRFDVRVAYSEKEFAVEIATAQALVIGNSRYQSMAATIAADGRWLRWIQFSSSGIDALKREDLRSGIAVTRAVGVWTPAVAEHALALSLALLRQLPQYRHQQEERRWIDAATAGRMRSLSGMQVLVVGYGDVGKTFAAYARPLGAVITPVATAARTEDGVEIHAVAQLSDLLPRADLVVMTASGRSDGRPLLDAAGLALLRPSAYLVNVARGSLIAEDALSQRLAAGQLAGAALDVTAVEPLPASSPLWDTPNLILTSHVAGAGDPSALERLALLCTTNAVNLLQGKALVGVV